MKGMNKMENKYNKYGDFIAKHRRLSGFKSQRQLADKTGISSATISRIEANVQKPNPDTLKVLAQYLHTTSLVELMVVCGYWSEDDLLEPIKANESSPASSENEREFIRKSLELTDDEILKEFTLKIDGKELSEQETRNIIAFVRTLRNDV